MIDRVKTHQAQLILGETLAELGIICTNDSYRIMKVRLLCLKCLESLYLSEYFRIK